MPAKLTLKYDDAFIADVASLPVTISEALYAFLERLAENPDSPDLRAEPASRNGLWGCQFTQGYCVYWKVERESEKLLTLSSCRPKLISLVKLKPRTETLRSKRA
jgi:hypothetical protein